MFVAVARKAGPFSALAYALGPDAVLRLPGWFGDFLLDAEQVRAQLPAAEETRSLTGAQRRDAVELVLTRRTSTCAEKAVNEA
ncbi:hypothetical protein [Streptomyces mirabilis]|uniref:hypothetical protein n=1 Tax=Streptomyces mirabilis TaxID=68239 RepID=UPI002255A003|nr:hypothetical protein [Streptomyces mirabilis]MCX4420132.1 hypothetical protein [Streptomyces mirabilis]